MSEIKPQKIDERAREAARRRWDAVAKPLHSLGLLEDMVSRLAGIGGSADVRLDRRCALVFCGDHGVVAQGVAQSGSEVTALVARSIAEGTANVNLMAASAGADVLAVDVGMARDVDHPALLRRKIARGTDDITLGPAMSPEQARRALQIGIDVVGEMKSKGYGIAAVGEMGIGNTTSASAVACALLELPPERLTGRGAGLSDAGLTRKREAVRRAIQVNRPDPHDPLDVLAKLGGYDIAGMAGAFLGGMIHRMPMIVDGMISAAAALLAERVCPGTREFMLPSHVGREPASARLLRALGLSPVISAQLALGEGTGAVLLIPMLDMALRVYNGTHTFENLGMEAYAPQEEKP